MDEFEHKEFLLGQPYIVPLEYISLDDHELIKNPLFIVVLRQALKKWMIFDGKLSWGKFYEERGSEGVFW